MCIGGGDKMIRINEIKLPVSAGQDELKKKAAFILGISQSEITELQLYKRSLDCRRKNDIKYIYSVDVTVSGSEEAKLIPRISDPRVSRSEIYRYQIPENRRRSAFRPIVAGFGPAGMFCALMLARAGLSPIVVERGHDADRRAADIKEFELNRKINEHGNIQFGEGGAGTFSDGKLTTGIKDKRVREVFNVFASHGAPEDILYSATPHIGTDKLPGVVKNIRQEIISLGGDVFFGLTLTDIITANHYVHGVCITDETGNSRDIETDTVVLCTGHSAGDTIEMLYKKGIDISRKPFSVGVRIEHPRDFIDRAQYGDTAAHLGLESASYKLSAHPIGSRGLYTFCMCPGGTVVNASSAPGRLVVNGMSEYARDKENSNSALLVGIDPGDFPGTGPLAGLELQSDIEKSAYVLGGGDFTAPAQLLGDFMQGKESK